jgi:signal transduction histidine kinase
MCRAAVRLYRLSVASSLFRPTAAWRAFALDLALVLVVSGVIEWNVWVFHTLPGPKGLTAPLPLLLALPLFWRRTRALLVVTLVIAGVVLQSVATGNSAEGIELIVAVGVAAYSVGAYSERSRALVGLGLLAVGYAIYALEDRNIQSGRTSELWAGAFFGIGVLAAWLIGSFVRSSRERATLAAVAAAHERAALDAIAEERARLARELHDIVSHNLSVVVLQAGGARAQGEHAPGGVLEKIERSSREALIEMRRLLGVLREDDHDATLAPQPGIAQLEALAATMRAAGLPVELSIDGEVADLPPALDLSAYRIVQEALTNTLKHAGAARAQVEIRRRLDALTIDVVDNGLGKTNGDRSATGHGLVGMRERVSMFGGTLDAAPRDEGGFAVHARLPLGEAR